MAQFEVGKYYTHGWIGDSSMFTTWKVIKRTKCTVTIECVDDGRVKTCRFCKWFMDNYGVETIYPYGQYSMAPILDANDIEKAA